MPKFFPGCPVKKNRGTESIGITARVVQFPYFSSISNFNMLVRLDSATLFKAAGEEAGVIADQWDPIVPDGMKPVEQSELLCLPDGSFNEAGTLTPMKEEAKAV